MNHPASFTNLTPEDLMKVVEIAKLFPTGEYTQLNSYENRVFEIRLEPTPLSPWKEERVIAKVYRPNRWTKEALLEEHEFISDLALEGLPTSRPLDLFPKQTTLFEHKGFFFSLFPKIRGRMPQEFLPGELRKVGQRLAQLHNVGARKESWHRPPYHPDDLGDSILDILQGCVPPEIWGNYLETAEDIFDELSEELEGQTFQRIHGDCHRGNLLQDEKGTFFFVDFDDFGPGPLAQDFWMLLSSENLEESQGELEELLSGYEELREPPVITPRIVNLLRAFRIVKYASWIGARWGDASFPKMFPEFKSYSYWAEELRNLDNLLNNASQ